MSTKSTEIASLSRITKRYSGAASDAVRDVSLTLRPGEFYSLLGPSGCGKSTLLRIVGGFEQQTSGSVTIAGADMAGRSANRRPTNMVFQHLGLFPHLDVAGNIGFGLRIKRMPKEERRQEIAKVLDLVDLAGYQERFPAQLSGGQQQRVAIARALVNQPAVLLLDEPLAALDLKLRHQMHEVLKELQRTSGTTFLYVTHDQSEAMSLSDRVAVMKDGELCQVGTAEEIYSHPTSSFVARFIGDANVIDTEVRDGVAVIDGMTVKAGSVESGTAFSIRPEHVVLQDTASAPGVEAVVMGITFQGASIRYDLATRSGVQLRALRPTDAPRLEAGGTVRASWSPAEAVVLRE